MKFLFLDLESADGISSICEFGYVLTTSTFKVLKKENILVNPATDKFNTYVIENLGLDPLNYKDEPTFDYYYDKFKELLSLKDTIIIGHTFMSDSLFLYNDIKRYKLEQLSYSFYDIKDIYMIINHKSSATGLSKMLEELNIEFVGTKHNALDDSYNTMLGFKELFFRDYSSDTIEDFLLKYSPIISKVNKGRIKTPKMKSIISTFDNTLAKGTKRYDKLLYFIANLKPRKDVRHSPIKYEKVHIASSFTKNHYRETLNLIKLIFYYGGSYTTKVESSDLYISYFNKDITEEEKNEFLKIKKNGKQKIIPLDKFLLNFNLGFSDLIKLDEPSFDSPLVLKEEERKPQTKIRKNKTYVLDDLEPTKNSLGSLIDLSEYLDEK